jgi:hypothetical protein
MTNEANGRLKLDVVEVDPASLPADLEGALAALDAAQPFEPDSEPAPMVVRELRSRYWIGGCGALNFGVKVTEGVPGQFDGVPLEPREVACVITSHNHKITIWPVDAGIYEQWTADGDDDEG